MATPRALETATGLDVGRLSSDAIGRLLDTGIGRWNGQRVRPPHRYGQILPLSCEYRVTGLTP
jgi:hypothetical protein